MSLCRDCLEEACACEQCRQMLPRHSAPAKDDFVLCSVLAFDDDTLSVQLLHRGTKKSCVEAADLIDALSYSGPKRVTESCVRWMPYQMYADALNGIYPKAGTP